MNNKQTVSHEEYRRLDNRVTCILQQRCPANEISPWVGMLQGKQQAVASAILRRRPRPVSLALPAIATEAPSPYQAKASRPTVPVHSADGRLLAAAIRWTDSSPWLSTTTASSIAPALVTPSG